MKTPNPAYISLSVSSDAIKLDLQGDWIVERVLLYKRSIFSILEKLRAYKSHKNLVLSGSNITNIDLAGSLVLDDFIQQLQQVGFDVKAELSSTIEKHLHLAEKYAPSPLITENKASYVIRKLEKLGIATYNLRNLTCHMLNFLGELTIALGRILIRPHFFRFKSFIKHIGVVGLNAVPIVTLISFLIGIVLAYQGITQLARFGAQIYTVNLLGLGVLREVGVLLTSVVIAGRSGSAYTAEIGMMVVNEEVSALRVMGLSPFYLLTLPRILALVVALPLLTFLSDIVALVGGAIMMRWLLDTSYVQFMSQFLSAINTTAFWVGIVKAPFFGFVIGFVGCFEGMQVKGSAESVGLQTTKSVVESIFLIIVLDAMFSILFAYVGI